jgi:hypothetical protein
MTTTTTKQKPEPDDRGKLRAHGRLALVRTISLCALRSLWRASLRKVDFYEEKKEVIRMRYPGAVSLHRSSGWLGLRREFLVMLPGKGCREVTMWLDTIVEDRAGREGGGGNDE